MCQRETIGYQARAIVRLDLANFVLTAVTNSARAIVILTAVTNLVSLDLAVISLLGLAGRHQHNQEFELHYSAPPEVQSAENTSLLHGIRHP
ncbi:hypothetical protein LguiA_017117 [Lonicera macranthoides]